MISQLKVIRFTQGDPFKSINEARATNRCWCQDPWEVGNPTKHLLNRQTRRSESNLFFYFCQPFLVIVFHLYHFMHKQLFEQKNKTHDHWNDHKKFKDGTTINQIGRNKKHICMIETLCVDLCTVSYFEHVDLCSVSQPQLSTFLQSRFFKLLQNCRTYCSVQI